MFGSLVITTIMTVEMPVIEYAYNHLFGKRQKWFSLTVICYP